MEAHVRQRLAGGGFLFVALVIASLVLLNPPGSDASPAKVVDFYHRHKSQTAVSAYVIELAVFVALFFYWYLRDYLSSVPANRRLATVGFAGLVSFAVSGGLVAGISWTLADSVNHLSAASVQTLNALQNDLNTFLGGPGAAVFLVATGAAIVRSNLLARWLGWVAVVLGALSLGVPFASVGTVTLWTLVASTGILVRARRDRGDHEPEAGPPVAASEPNPA
jgi:hypothetical protein